MEEIINNHRRKKIAAIVFSVIAVTGALILFFYLRYRATHITTDNAYVEGFIHIVSSKVSGTVSAIYVKDNQYVRKGELLLEIDPADYDVKVKEAEAALEAERKRLDEINSRIEAAEKQLEQAVAALEAQKANLELQKANFVQAELDFRRAEALFKKEAISRAQYDKAKTAYDVAQAQLRAAEEQVRQAQSSIEAQKALLKQAESLRPLQLANIKQKEAVLQAARLKHEYTKIYAPSDGYITKKSVEQGNLIREGQPLMAVVPLQDVWIVANYKETQLEKIRPGQRVKIKVDTYPGRVFWGRVDSLMAGTGAVFSLFPPENATGNYVKVVQRIPVKIVLEKGTDSKHMLRVGMSAVTTVIVKDE
ncbi:MAG: HlyD family secretion protein [Thermodesulfovibrionales bacterium]|nr:HlyD family secretion protein [Thermodesulfovibrionales bacterium]